MNPVWVASSGDGRHAHRRWLLHLLVLIMALAAAACRKKAASHEAPATVSHAAPEAEIATVTLSPQAEARLGIKVAPLERRVVESVRVLGGEILVPPGRTLVVNAPVAGLVRPPPSDATVSAGSPVDANQTLLQLLPLPPDSDISRAREDLIVAESRHVEARLEAERMQNLFAEQLVPERDLERARANFQAAEATLQHTRAQIAALTQDLTGEGSTLAVLSIRSPVTGVIRLVHVAPGQIVATGSPLFQVDQLDRLWVRVPVYVGDVNQVVASRPATVTTLGGGGAVRTARPVRAPLSANPLAASADLFYEIEGETAGLRPGERVSVAIPLRRGASERLVVASSATLHDAQGGTWVYERIKPHAYARRRVDLAHTQGGLAVLTRGPAPGTPVVIEGAAELFGTEFGAGH